MARRAPPLPPLVPAPKRALSRPGALPLHPGVPIVLAPGADERDFASACALRDAVLAAGGGRLPIETHARRDDLPPHVALLRGDARGREGDAHRIAVDARGARLEGAGSAGLRWAVATASQLVAAPRGARGAARLPACEIEDAPDFARRGLMLDVSRGKVPTPATLGALVDLAARLKPNVLVLYVEHTFRFRRHPEIGAGWSPLTAETLRALDAYADLRHVELVPCLQSLGHMSHVLALPRYAHLAETERRWTLAPAEPGSYALLEDLYDEFLPNFRSRLFHANCDEPWDLGRGRSAELSRRLGPGGLYLAHVRRLHALAAKHGRRLAIWGDVVHAHPDRIPELPSDLLLLDWGYDAAHDVDRVSAFARHGFECWVCPGTSSWNSLFPRFENAERNVAAFAAAGRRHGASGLLHTDWGDFGHFNLQGFSWHSYAWAAQHAWSGDAKAAAFDRAFARLVFGDASGETARLYRALGACHDAGFPLPNASPLLALWFDDLGPAAFSAKARADALRRTERRLLRVRRRIVASRARFRREGLTGEELLYAAESSLLAVRKGLAGLAWVAWRRAPDRLDARARRALARRLCAIADEQVALGRRLRRLWLARSEPGGFVVTATRLRRSVRSLRAAARALARGVAPPLPEAAPQPRAASSPPVPPPAPAAPAARTRRARPAR